MAKEDKQTRVAVSNSCGQAKDAAKKSPPSSPIHCIVYVLCISSLGAALYSTVRLRNHDERIRSLEEILRQGAHPWSPSEGVVVTQSRVPSDISVEKDHAWNSEELLEQLQHQVAGIQQRLRRDVSEPMQLIRPQRQLPDCHCPPGKCRFWGIAQFRADCRVGESRRRIH